MESDCSFVSRKGPVCFAFQHGLAASSEAPGQASFPSLRADGEKARRSGDLPREGDASVSECWEAEGVCVSGLDLIRSPQPQNTYETKESGQNGNENGRSFFSGGRTFAQGRKGPPHWGLPRMKGSLAGALLQNGGVSAYVCPEGTSGSPVQNTAIVCLKTVNLIRLHWGALG